MAIKCCDSCGWVEETSRCGYDGPFKWSRSKCEGWKPRKEPVRTNADRIRSMTDEELAEVIVEWCPNPEDGKCECTPYKDLCTRCWLTWLQQEVKE